MKISIRKSKHQKGELIPAQLQFANKCVEQYFSKDLRTEFYYKGENLGLKMGCDIYRTATQISAIVYFK